LSQVFFESGPALANHHQAFQSTFFDLQRAAAHFAQFDSPCCSNSAQSALDIFRTYRSRLALLDEDVRPENVERALSGVGTTRTVELREVRRRSLEIEKRGLESLVVVIGQSRARLEEDLRQADSLCSKLRQRLFPLIEKEVDKISP
jgi:hypothetical protein